MKDNSNRPLWGWHIVILRSKHQARSLYEQIQVCGGEPILLPTIDIFPLTFSSQQLERDQNRLRQADLIFIASANVVYCLPEALLLLLQGNNSCIVTMGKATTQTLAEKSIEVFFTAPSGSTSESVLEQSFLQMDKVSGKEIVLLAGEDGRTLLADTLSQRGAHIHWIKVYRQQPIKLNLKPFIASWRLQRDFCFVVMSHHSLENLLVAFPSEDLTWLHSQMLVTISQRIALKAKEWGFQHIFVAQGAHPEEIGSALQEMAQACGTMHCYC